MNEAKRIILLVNLLLLIILLISYKIILFNNLKQETKCYKYLYNEDYVAKGCDKYFRNDSWYIEYTKHNSCFYEIGKEV